MESQELGLEKYVMLGYVSNIEDLILKYRNVVEQSGSYGTLDMGELLLDQITENMVSLKQRHASHVNIEKEENHQK